MHNVDDALLDTQTMADYDLTKRTIPYLDRHLAIPILAYLTEKTVFNVDQVRASQYELAKGTNMVDYTIGLFKELYPDEEVPEGASKACCNCVQLIIVPKRACVEAGEDVVHI